jgi:hypothetical protein
MILHYHTAMVWLLQFSHTQQSFPLFTVGRQAGQRKVETYSPIRILAESYHFILAMQSKRDSPTFGLCQFAPAASEATLKLLLTNAVKRILESEEWKLGTGIGTQETVSSRIWREGSFSNRSMLLWLESSGWV